MTSKKETPIKTLNGARNAQQLEIKPTTPPTVEELQKQLAEANAKLSKIPNSLEQRQEYFKLKNELLKKYTSLERMQTELNTHLDTLAEKAAVDDFTNEEYSFALQYKEYREHKDLIRIKNPILIGEVISFVLGKLNVKKQELKSQIEA